MFAWFCAFKSLKSLRRTSCRSSTHRHSTPSLHSDQPPLAPAVDARQARQVPIPAVAARSIWTKRCKVVAGALADSVGASLVLDSLTATFTLACSLVMCLYQ